MALSTVQVTGTFDDGSESPLAGTVTFTPSSTVYASGVPVLQPDVPVVAQIVGGVLKNQAGGTLTLVATDNGGLSVRGLTGFWYWTVQVTVGGQATEPWSFFLPSSPSTVDLYSLVNTPPVAPYLPLPSGEAVEGYVPVATGEGAASAWGNPIAGALLAANNLSDVASPPVAYQRLSGGHSAKMQGWFASLADRQLACTSIAVIGTSITMGEGASAFPNTWCQRLAALLRSRYGVSGGGRGWLNPEPHSLTTWSPPYVTVSGSPASHNGFSPELLTWNFTAGGQQWVYSLNGDSADIMWVANPGDGSFTYKVDSGSTTTVSTSTTYTDGSITHVSLGSPGAHTLTIAYASGSPVYIDGVREYNGDYSAGLQVNQCGFGGAITSDWAGTTSDPHATPAAVAALNPGLVIIELGINDYYNSITASETQTNLTTLIAGLRSAIAYANPPYPPPFLLLADYNGYGHNGMSDSLWQTYVSAMYAVAAADSEVDILDLSLRMPSTAAANDWGLYASDLLHPSDKGHQMIADTVCQFLSPA